MVVEALSNRASNRLIVMKLDNMLESCCPACCPAKIGTDTSTEPPTTESVLLADVLGRSWTPAY